MYKFKKGDKVICIKDSSNNAFWLDKNKIYTIEALSEGSSLFLKEEKDLWYLKSRFKLANSHVIKERLGIK